MELRITLQATSAEHPFGSVCMMSFCHNGTHLGVGCSCKRKKQAKERKNEKSQLTHKKTEEQDKKYLKK